MRPNFWKDQLWFYPSMIIIFHLIFSIFFSVTSKDLNGVIFINIMLIILVDPLFWLLFFDSIFNTAYFEQDKVIFKSFLWKTVIPYKNIRAFGGNEMLWPTLVYLDAKNDRTKPFRLFTWPHSITKIIQELERRCGKFANYQEDKVLKIANNNRWSKVWIALIIIIVLTGTLLALHFNLFVKK
jgi:hypothetical protein